MSIVFNPTGSLNLSVNPSDLPESGSGSDVISGAMKRCKNLRLDINGKAETRDGSNKFNSTAISASDWDYVYMFDWEYEDGYLTGVEKQTYNISEVGSEIYAHTHDFESEILNGSSSVSSDDVALKAMYLWEYDLLILSQEVTISGDIDYDALSVNNIIVLDGDRYSFADENIYLNETRIETGLSTGDWSTISYNSYNSTDQEIFALNGTERKRINGSTVSEWGITAPTVAPTLAVGSSTGLTGDYNAMYTYARYSGTTLLSESDPSPAAAAAQGLANESLKITWTASSDSQVTHVRVYRTLTGGAIYYFDQNVAIGTTTLDSDTGDADLGTQVETNHDRPPTGSFVFGPTYNGISFILKDNLLYFSLSRQPEYWPSDYYLEVSIPQFPLICGTIFNGQPYVFSKNKIYFIQGTGASTFFPIEMNCQTGAQGQRGVCAVKGFGIFHTGTDGIYLYSEIDKKFTKNNFDPLFRGESVNGVPAVDSMETAWLFYWHGRLYFGYASLGYDYPNNCLVFDLETSKSWYFTWDQEFRCIAYDNKNDYLITGSNDGFVWRIENPNAIKDHTDSIEWEIESKDFMLPTRKHFPRWIKYDINAENADSVTGQYILDDTTFQTHTITDNRNTRRRLLPTGNGNKASIRISGAGPVEIYTTEAE